MGSDDSATLNTLPDDVHPSILELRERHRLELQNLTLTTQPFRTLQLFIFSTLLHLKRSFLYVLMKGSRFLLLSMLIVGFSVLFITTNGSREKHAQEFLNYFRFVLWWVALGVASSIGLGSGLHTFVLYLGPHIALFTIKAMKCGRVDLKFAPYDTIQLKRGPSWLEKDCTQFGPPLYLSSAGSLVKIPVSIILPHVQLEAVLWGIGTALGELPPYFISSAARMSGNKLDAMEELDASSKDDGFVSAFLKRLKRWFLNHAQHLNFFTILVLASVPNPLFDLAGIMCGQFGIPFWKFFLATLTGKAIIKTHIQTVFIICVCNNQLLEWVENELLWLLGLFPGFSYMVPNIITKLHLAKEKYLSAPVTVASAVSDIQGEKRWNMSFSLIWNSVVWLMLVNFFIKIVTATAQRYLKKQQDMELKKLLESKQSNKG